MIGLLQRVSHASVTVNGDVFASINNDLLVLLLGVENNDSEKNAGCLFDKLVSYRVFADDQDKMNPGMKDVQGELLIVPQ